MYNITMKYERDGLLLPPRTEPQIDEELYSSLKVVQGDEKAIYEQLYLSSERKIEAAEALHSGTNPSFLAESVDEEALLAKQAALRQWKQELLLRKDLDPDVQQLYRWKVNEHIANTNMLIASSKGDMDNFHRWNKFIYGTPDEDIYRGALDWVAHDAEVLINKPDQNQPTIDAAQRVLEMLANERGYREILSPDAEIFEKVRSDHMRPMGYYGLLMEGITMPEGKINQEIGDPIVHAVLENIGSQKTVQNAAGATWSVAENAVLRPATYSLPAVRFQGLALGHEVGTHELERTNGGRGPLALLAEGLDRYESGNEGRAVVREEVVYKNFDEFGKIVRWRDILRRHIAISYASGVGEDSPRSSSETYEFMNTIDAMYQTKLKPTEPVLAFEAAQKKTDDLITRVLKGTDGTGGAYLKDKVYLEGHVSNWLQAATHGAEVISSGDLGKYDIANDRHIMSLQKFNLLPVET
jgi:hypothetical protein